VLKLVDFQLGLSATNPDAKTKKKKQTSTNSARGPSATRGPTTQELIDQLPELLTPEEELEQDERAWAQRVEKARKTSAQEPEANDFFLASQLWVRGDMYNRRTDLVGFVNGIPLLFLELKASHKTLKAAYDDNLTDYRYAIPQLFVPNGLVVLSNGSDTVVGSTFAPPWR